MFDILAPGPFRPDQLSVRWCDDGGRAPDPEVDALVAATWDRRIGEAAVRGQLLFAGPLCRLVDWAVAADRLTLVLGPTDYRDFVGTNAGGLAAIQARHPADWRRYLANPLAVCTVLISADGWLLLMQRSQRVAEYAGAYHAVGGHPTPAHRDADGRPSPVSALYEEITEETGVTASEVAALVCTGLITNRTTAKPELVFAARLALDRPAIAARLDARPEHDEDAAWIWLPDEPASLRHFLTENAAVIAPAGAGCLRLYADLSPLWRAETPS